MRPEPVRGGAKRSNEHHLLRQPGQLSVIRVTKLRDESCEAWGKRARSANRTYTEEFYQVTASQLQIKQSNREFSCRWERIYGTARPHQSLGYVTPQQFLLRRSSQRKE